MGFLFDAWLGDIMSKAEQIGREKRSAKEFEQIRQGWLKQQELNIKRQEMENYGSYLKKMAAKPTGGSTNFWDEEDSVGLPTIPNNYGIEI
ncbi:MAG: hypothetical protein ABIJ08_05015, partial [Nanoarchaeota archaeon]